jgi:hypothetical protein
VAEDQGTPGDAGGAAQQSTPVPTVVEGDVHFYFPVEIEVRPAEAGVDVDEVVGKALSQLVHGIKSTA